MASICLLSTADGHDGVPVKRDILRQLRRYAALDTFGVHRVEPDPHQADLILFVYDEEPTGALFERVRSHPLVKRYREKCFVYCSVDWPVPFLPGLYASLDKRWYHPERVRGVHYLRTLDDDRLDHIEEAVDRRYLFSFVGAFGTDRIRSRLARLEHPEGYVIDTDGLKVQAREDPAVRAVYENGYVEVAQASRFMLCPRGRGASSMRLFEAMRMGRAPVIISDAWIAPEGPDWDTFSVRIAESEIDRIPRILEARRADAVEMGRRARRVWEDWFSREASFHRIVEGCLRIQQSRTKPEAVLRLTALAQFRDPFYLRMFMRRKLYRRWPGLRSTLKPVLRPVLQFKQDRFHWSNEGPGTGT